jgi:HEAT repeat protein
MATANLANGRIYTGIDLDGDGIPDALLVNKDDIQVILTRACRLVANPPQVYQEQALLEMRIHGKGHLNAISACIDRIYRDRSNWIRCSAARTLGEIAPRHDHTAVTVLSETLEDPSDLVRAAAFQGLAMVDPAAALKALSAYDPSKRSFATEGLVQLIQDRWPFARTKAAEALRYTARRGDRSAVLALAGACHAGDEACRINAAQSLECLAIRGDINAIGALISSSKDQRWEHSFALATASQCAAVDALGKVVHPGDAGAIGAVTTCSQVEGNDMLRAACLRTLAAIDPCFNKSLATQELLKLLEDPDIQVRAQAALGLESVAEPDNQAVLSAVAACRNCRGFEEAVRQLQRH